MKSEKRKKALGEKHAAKARRMSEPGGASMYVRRDESRMVHNIPKAMMPHYSIDELCAQWPPMGQRAR